MNFPSSPLLGGGLEEDEILALGFMNVVWLLNPVSISSRAVIDSLCFGCICLINLSDVDNWARFNSANLRNDQANLVHI